VNHAMYYQLEQYITLAQVYSEPPQSFWQDLCQLYEIAEHYEMTNLQTKNEIDPSQPKTSPKSLFTHACLLSLSNLHTYGHGEAGKIANHLSKASLLINLSDALPEDSEYTFYINLSLCSPVRLMPNSEIPVSSKNRYIDATAVVNELETISESQSNEYNDKITSLDALNKSLAKRLLKKLTSKPIRASKRAIPAKGRLHLAIGFRDIVEVLQQGHAVNQASVEPTKANQSNLELMPIENSNISAFFNDNHNQYEDDYLVSSSNAWDWISRGNVVTEKNEYTNEHVSPEKNKQGKEVVSLSPVVQTWDISNASRGNNTSDYQSQIGDIVLLRLEDKQNDAWRLGVIRWMQSLSTHGVKMGIETLNGSVDLLEVIDAHQASERSTEVEFLLQLTDETSNETKQTLVAPPNAALTGDQFVLLKDDKKQTIVCQKRLEQTISFAQFSYSVVPALPSDNSY